MAQVTAKYERLAGRPRRLHWDIAPCRQTQRDRRLNDELARTVEHCHSGPDPGPRRLQRKARRGRRPGSGAAPGLQDPLADRPKACWRSAWTRRRMVGKAEHPRPPAGPAAPAPGLPSRRPELRFLHARTAGSGLGGPPGGRPGSQGPGGRASTWIEAFASAHPTRLCRPLRHACAADRRGPLRPFGRPASVRRLPAHQDFGLRRPRRPLTGRPALHTGLDFLAGPFPGCPSIHATRAGNRLVHRAALWPRQCGGDRSRRRLQDPLRPPRPPSLRPCRREGRPPGNASPPWARPAAPPDPTFTTRSGSPAVLKTRSAS